MNRIYQGRVQRVSEKLEDGTERALVSKDNSVGDDQSANPLWRHHEIFQDAVNYYLVAMASLAEAPEASEEWRFMKDMRARVGTAWDRFPREDAARQGAKSLRQSLAKWLELPANASLDDAFHAILKGAQADARTRAYALALVLQKCAGDSAIQQGGRAYLPMLCWSGSTASFDYTASAVEASAGKDSLAAVLHGDPTLEELKAISCKMDLSWTVKVQEGKFYEGNEARERVLEALDHLAGNVLTEPPPRLAELLRGIDDPAGQIAQMKVDVQSLSDDFRLPRNRKAAKDLTFASIAFMVFPSELTRQCLRVCIKQPGKAPKKKKGLDLCVLGDDPVRLARGERGFVFPAFTALQAWGAPNAGEPAWKEFDIAAFKEALKSLNQFKQKTAEREERQQDLRGHIAHLLGKPLPGWKPANAEGEEDVELGEPLAPILLELALNLEEQLTLSLSEAVVGERRILRFGEASLALRDGGWTVTRASLRGFRDIRDEWVKIASKHGASLTTAHLEEVVREHQRDEARSRRIGSVPLFMALCAEEFRPLWLDEEGDPTEDGGLGGSSFLSKLADLHELVREFERTEEPIQLTPAEPRHSRRLFMFSDLGGRYAPKKESESAMVVSVASSDANGRCTEKRLTLHFSAPRLRRDQLAGNDEPIWLQPMVEALELKLPPATDGFDPAFSLMPDFDEHGRLRYLLNFAVEIDALPLQAALGKAWRWKGNFNGTKDKNLHLHWPHTLANEIKNGAGPWWSNPEVIAGGFTLLSVDLGQRTAGAWALLRVTAERPDTERPVRPIGHDGTREWFAEVLRTGMLRLPGEDAMVRGKDGRMHQELSGLRGRMADEAEWLAAKELAVSLQATEPEKWVGRTRGERSHAEQNDALLALASRRLSRLATLHRWSCFDPDKPGLGGRRESLVKALDAELEHWQDPEIAGWRGLLAAEDIQGFRRKAGEAFVRYRAVLGAQLLRLADRTCPLRGRRWSWQGRGDTTPYGQLLWEETGKAAKVRGQRGLSMARLEQLENLRRLFLRYNRSLDRSPGEPAVFGREDAGRASGEPCSLLLAKIDQMKDERVNQTAHLILAQALGVRLAEHRHDRNERIASDRHGEYARVTGREPVDMIVIENLDRYLTSQGRAPSENSRLMKWAHRAVRDKIKMLAEEPFGIPVVEVGAAYSSRFCAVTSEAGARCEEREGLDDYLKEQFEKRALQPPSAGQLDQRSLYARLLEQFSVIQKENAKRASKAVPPLCLLVPKAGGPLFLGARSASLRQADANAAANLGLRAVASPRSLHLLHKVRAVREAEVWRPRADSRREKAVWTKASRIELPEKLSAKLFQATAVNFFHDSGGVAQFDRADAVVGSERVPLASGVGLWRGVNERFLARVVAENDERLLRQDLVDFLPM